MSRLTVIVAATKSNGIGQNSRLPWRLPKEMKYFANVTSNAPEGQSNAVIMGRNTWESIPKKFRPLSKRVNIVISRNPDYQLNAPDAYLHNELDSAFARLSDLDKTDRLHHAFIIGGASLYAQSLALQPPSSLVDRILLTRIISPAFDECDTFMPDFLQEGVEKGREWQRASHDDLNSWVKFEVPAGIQEENGVNYEFQMWVREP